MYLPHAKNYLDFQPKLPPPVYVPEIAAQAILYAAQRPKRDIYVGGASKVSVLAAALMPGWTDLLLSKIGTSMQKKLGVSPDRSGESLFKPSAISEEVRSGQNGHVFETSTYTHITTEHQGTLRLIGAFAVGLGLLMAVRAVAN